MVARFPNVTFEIKPLTLHKSASQVLLELGDQKLTYRHGPPRQERMQWPPPSGSNRARVLFTPLGGGRTANLSAEGPWAFFPFARQGRGNADSERGSVPGDLRD